jgi:hypothetical protein
VAAPAGEHKVTLRYQPLSFALELWIMAVLYPAVRRAARCRLSPG